MKTNSVDKPVSQFEVEFIGSRVLIKFFENIEEKIRTDFFDKEEKETKYYEYDLYYLETENTENLIWNLNDGEKYKKYLAAAKEKEFSEDETKLEKIKQEIIELSTKIEALKINGLFSNEELQKKLNMKIKEHKELAIIIADKGGITLDIVLKKLL